MNYEANERIKHLSDRIRLIKEPKSLDMPNSEVLQLDFEWRVGDLFAELIYYSELQIPHPSQSILNEFYSTHPQNKLFVLNDLFQKHWLRCVMNRIEVPAAVRLAISDIKKGFPKEFPFIANLSQILNKRTEKTFTNEELKELLEKYNSDDSNEPLNENDLKEKGVVTSESIQSNKFVLHPHSKYYLFLQQNQVFFEFIGDFSEKYLSGDAKYLKISKTLAIDLITKHKDLYINCPSVEEFRNKKILFEYEDHFIFKLSYGDFSDWWSSLSGLIAGKLWNKINADKNFSNETKLDNWLDKLVINHDYPSTCLNFMPFEIRKEFLELIEKRLTEEPDIHGCSSEIEKLLLESSRLHGRNPFVDAFYLKFQEEQSPAEKYRLVEELEDQTHNIFFEQSCRNRLGLLLHLLIRAGQSTENPQNSFPAIMRLLKASSDRPYLLWEICILLEHIRPEIIPYLFAEKELEELGILLIQTIKINPRAVAYGEREGLFLGTEKIRTELNAEGLVSFLNCINFQKKEPEAAPILARVLLEMSLKVFSLPYNYDREKEKQKLIQRNAYNETWEIISRYRLSQRFIYNYGSDNPLYFFYLLKDFLIAITDYKSPEPFNEFYSPEIWRFDVFIRFLKILRDPVLIARNVLQSNYVEDIEKVETETIDTLHRIYLNTFKIIEIEVKSGAMSAEKRQIQFQSNVFGIQQISWQYYIQSLTQEKREEFFQIAKPNFNFSNANAETILWDKEVQIIVQRLRFHLKVMLNAYASINENAIPDEELLGELEKNITWIFCKYSITNLSENAIDIFDKNYDAYSEEYLFGRVIEVLNAFKDANRKKILNCLVENGQFDRVLFALNLLTSEGDKNHLLRELTNEKLEAFLDQQYSYIEIENALINAINNPGLITFAERIISHIETIAPKIAEQFEHQRLLYHVKLLLAYRKDEYEKLESIIPPKDSYDNYSQKQLTENARKKYYEILFLFRRGELSDALKEANQLVYERKNEPDMLNLKFSIEVEMAKKEFETDTEKGIKSINTALETFLAGEKMCLEDSFNENIKRDILLNKMECYHYMGLNENFDALITQIRKIDKYSEPFASLIVDNKLKRDQLTEVSVFIEYLKNYHKHRSNIIPDFIEKFLSKLSIHKEHFSYLKSAYKSLLTLSVEDRIKVFPDVISKQTNNYGEFLLGEILKAIIMLQQKLFALLTKGKEAKDLEEDKITDFLETVLNARLSAWQMEWHSQARLGTTGEDTNQLARADLSSKVGNTTIVAEALRIYSYKNLTSQKKNIEDHILKTFNQTSTRKYFYNLIYYQGDDFKTDWVSLKTIISSTSFPNEYAFTSPLEEETELSTSDLKVCKTKHENEVICYHIFVNVVYKT